MKKIPWEDKPTNSNEVIWRFSKNPVIKRDAIPSSNSIFNSAAIEFEDGFAGIFRCDNKAREMNIHAGFSKDGITWEIEHEPINFISADLTDSEVGKSAYKYDPRICKIEDKYYITWCNGYHGPTIGVGYTYDFKTFYQTENAFLPFNRNGVLFPRKINGKFAMLSRPSDNGHTPFGDIFYSESPDLIHWGKHRHVMSTTGLEGSAWQSTKVGAGPIPIEFDEGWLLLYHGVLTSCNGYVYHMGSAILDKEKPWVIKYRTRPYVLSPQTLYECVGDVPNVVFPCSALYDEKTGKIAVYYGAADTVTALAFTTLEEIVKFTKENTI